MDRNRLLMIVGFGALIILGGTLLGTLLGKTVPGYTYQQETADLDPVERFELGRNSFTPPKVRNRKTVVVAPNENTEYGARRNGKRLLVPSESAKKKERMRLAQEQRALDAWRMESLGEETQLSDAAAPAQEVNIYPASKTPKPMKIVQPPVKVVKNTNNEDAPTVIVDGQVEKQPASSGEKLQKVNAEPKEPLSEPENLLPSGN